MREKRKYQASKSTSNKRLKEKRDISYGLPHSEFLGIASTFSGLVLSFVLGLLGMCNTYASSISISLTGNVNLNLIKNNTTATFGTSTAQTATVTSDHFTGYTLTIAGSNDTGRLVGTNDNTKYLSSIDSPLTESVFSTDDTYNNQWGFLPGTLYINNTKTTNTNYQPSPTTTGTTIDVTNSPNTSGTNYTLALGAKVTPAMSLDSYSQTFVLAATGNGYDYFIGYTDDLNDMPENQYGTNSSETYVNLSSTTPVKAGYIFKGWCDQKTTNNGTTCPGTTYPAGQRIDLNSTSANHYDLHTIWEPVTFAKAFSDASASMTMQNMTTSICNAVAIGQESTLTDTRGGTYRVGKMADGHCWMLDNLALGRVTLTPSNSNITAESYIFPAEATTWSNSYTDAKIITTYNNTVPTDSLSTAGGWKVGTYYNYCAATAGTYCAGEGSGPALNAAYDICPKGWRMPSDDSDGEYKALSVAYANNYTDFRIAMHFPLSGYFRDNQTINQGNTGNWWSNSFITPYDMYRLNLNSVDQSINAGRGGYARFAGFPIRCIAK